MSLLIPLFIHSTKGLLVKLSDIKINAAAIEQGEWIGAAHGTPIPDMGDLCLRVRGVGNSDYRSLMAKLSDAAPRSQRTGGKLNPESSERIFLECLVETVLIDWTGVEGEDDQPIPFSKAVALKILLDPNLAPFKHAVAWAANQVGELRTSDSEATAKN